METDASKCMPLFNYWQHFNLVNSENTGVNFLSGQMRDPEEYEKQANQFMDKGDYENALKSFRQTCKMRGTFLDKNYYVQLCEAYIFKELAIGLSERNLEMEAQKEYLSAGKKFLLAQGCHGRNFNDYQLSEAANCFMVCFFSTMLFLFINSAFRKQAILMKLLFYLRN